MAKERCIGMDLKPNSVNQIADGQVIFEHEKPVRYIAMILKGRVEIVCDGMHLTLGQGNFIGVTDVYVGKYIAQYKASGPVILYPFEVTGTASIKTILAANKEYNGLMIASLIKFFEEITKLKDELGSCAEKMYGFVKKKYEQYGKICAANKISKSEFEEAERLDNFNEDFPADSKKLRYYTECAKVPLEVQKQFYSYSGYMTRRIVEDLSGVIAQLVMEVMDIAEYINDNYFMLCSDRHTSFVELEAALSDELVKNGVESKELISLVEDTIGIINTVENVMEKCTGKKLDINRAHIEEFYVAAVSGKTFNSEAKEVARASAEEDAAIKDEKIRRKMKKLEGALEQILEDAGLDDEKTKKFRDAVEALVKVTDRMSGDDNVRGIKRLISSVYYDVYEALFIKYYTEETLSVASELLLDYGFVDERLLSEKNLYTLCSFEPEEYNGRCNVYTLKEWLKLVYDGKKQPSKNEFDEEYPQYLRSMRKRGEISEEEEIKLSNDRYEKFRFEIHNMFIYNNRIVSGQPSTFAPVLYDDEFFGSMETQKLHKKNIDKSIDNLLQIDTSIFHREAVYSAPEIGITKEVVINQALPDVILLPSHGSIASMWQDISEKRRNSPGRFVFPVFLEGGLDDTMLKMFGRFRWELCRTMQGAMWNNIQYKSLTSEYSDYIQFYRKNHDLSEDRKEKIKLQIQKGRNNLREIFLTDYEIWIKYEASGAIKLNKVVREILATYCPLNPAIRERIGTQPVFAEAMARFMRENSKKVHELENRYRALSKDVKEMPAIIDETLAYYRNL